MSLCMNNSKIAPSLRGPCVTNSWNHVSSRHIYSFWYIWAMMCALMCHELMISCEFETHVYCLSRTHDVKWVRETHYLCVTNSWYHMSSRHIYSVWQIMMSYKFVQHTIHVSNSYGIMSSWHMSAHMPNRRLKRCLLAYVYIYIFVCMYVCVHKYAKGASEFARTDGCEVLLLLGHTATHCHALQYTTAHRNTLQHITTHCKTSQHTAIQCNTLQNTAKHCNTLQHTTTHCTTLQHTAIHCLPD